MVGETLCPLDALDAQHRTDMRVAARAFLPKCMKETATARDLLDLRDRALREPVCDVSLEAAECVALAIDLLRLDEDGLDMIESSYRKTDSKGKVWVVHKLRSVHMDGGPLLIKRVIQYGWDLCNWMSVSAPCTETVGEKRTMLFAYVWSRVDAHSPKRHLRDMDSEFLRAQELMVSKFIKELVEKPFPRPDIFAGSPLVPFFCFVVCY